MNFKSLLFDDAKNEVCVKNKKAKVCFIILSICIPLLYFKIAENGVILLFLFISMFIPLILKITSFFSYESSSKKNIGYIELNKSYIDLNGKKILWEEINTILILSSTYKGQFLNKSRLDYSNQLSLGIDNEIFIKTKSGFEFKGNYLIDSKHKIAELKILLWEVIKNNTISLENAKQMIFPENYKENQELKKYCSLN